MARDDIADFGTYLAEERHASQNTICSYLRDVTQFSAYLREHQSCTLRQAGGEMIQDYMSWMRGRGKSAASVTRFLASVKSFYNFLLSAGAVTANPAKGISAGPGGAEVSGDPHQQGGGAVSGAAPVRGCQGLPGPRHAGAALRHRHPGQRADLPGPGGPESLRGLHPLRQPGQGADHPPVPHGRQGAAGLCAEHPSPADRRQRASRPCSST